MINMQKILILILLLLLTASCSNQAVIQETEEFIQEQEKNYLEVHYSYSMDKDLFDGSYESIDVEPEQEKVFGAVVSHHLLSADSMARLFSSLQTQEIETIVIIGPNHFNEGDENVLISKAAYKTPYGSVEPDINMIEKMLEFDFDFFAIR